MIFKIFKRDVKKIFKNSMAVILSIGIALLPSLYAWFNIYANWDPYGSTGNMQIAVINGDEGAEIKGFKVDVGSEIVTNLKANDLIDWQFVSKNQGIDGVKSGKYYAAIEIPEGFSNSLTSIVTDNFKQPEIVYYANEKKNAIATKITDKVVGTVQTEVNESFVTTIVDLLGQVFGIVLEENDITDGNLFNKMSGEIDSAKTTVKELNAALGGFSQVTELSKQLSGSVGSKELSSFLNNTKSVIRDTSDVIKITKSSALEITGNISDLMSSAVTSLNSAASLIENYKPSQESVQALKSAAESCEKTSHLLDTAANMIEELNNSLPKPIDAVKRLVASLTSNASSLKVLGEKINGAVDGSYKGKLSDIANEIRTVSKNISDAKSDFSKSVKPRADEMISSLLNGLSGASDMISMLDEEVPTIDLLIKTLNTSLESGGDMFSSLQTMMSGFEKQLNSLSSKIDTLSKSEDLNAFVNLVSGKSEDLGAFIACPVKVNTDKVYGVDNYGSAMAPFYSTLAFWVGGVVLVAIMKTNVRHKKELGKVKDYQEFFGRAMLFELYALVQGLVICLGDLYFLKIQCYDPIKFILAGCLASLVFTFFIYSLAYTFGDIGKAVAVIFLVVQIGGSGGTFPIDVTPSFFRVINPYLPFTFVIDAMRECICGEFSADYWINILKLIVYLILALFVGLVLKIPFKKPIRFFNKKIEETDVF